MFPEIDGYADEELSDEELLKAYDWDELIQEIDLEEDEESVNGDEDDDDDDEALEIVQVAQRNDNSEDDDLLEYDDDFEDDDLTTVEDNIEDSENTDDDPDAPVSPLALLQQIETSAVERMERAARSSDDFAAIVSEWDRLDRNRERRERYHEILRDDATLEYQKPRDGLIFPVSLNTQEKKNLTNGNFLDILFDCPYEMHQLTANTFISNIVHELNDDYKQVLYFLSLKLFSTTQMARIRGQSARNIRKLRDTYTRRLQRRLYDHLCQKQNHGQALTCREREFISLYSAALKDKGKTNAKVRRENKTLKRKKTAQAESKSG